MTSGTLSFFTPAPALSTHCTVRRKGSTAWTVLYLPWLLQGWVNQESTAQEWCQKQQDQISHYRTPADTMVLCTHEHCSLHEEKNARTQVCRRPRNAGQVQRLPPGVTAWEEGCWLLPSLGLHSGRPSPAMHLLLHPSPAVVYV